MRGLRAVSFNNDIFSRCSTKATIRSISWFVLCAKAETLLNSTFLSDIFDAAIDAEFTRPTRVQPSWSWLCWISQDTDKNEG